MHGLLKGSRANVVTLPCTKSMPSPDLTQPKTSASHMIILLLLYESAKLRAITNYLLYISKKFKVCISKYYGSTVPIKGNKFLYFKNITLIERLQKVASPGPLGSLCKTRPHSFIRSPKKRPRKYKKDWIVAC